MSTKNWPIFKLTDGELFRHRIGPLTIFLRKHLNEIWAASSRNEEAGSDPDALPEKPEWNRMALPEEFEEFRIIPVLPDKPVIIDTEHSYRFVSKTRTRVYSRIPASVRITPVSREDLIIAEIPTVVLSETWFGTFTEGEFSYALSSKARRVLSEDLFEPHLIVCPMEIRNNSDHELKFEKICLRVERLSIFATENALWADETWITYQGKDTNSDMEMRGIAPAEAGDVKLVSRPRNPVKKSMGLKTFKLLKDFHIPGF